MKNRLSLNREGRKVRTPQGRMIPNRDFSPLAGGTGKCHREQTAPLPATAAEQG